MHLRRLMPAPPGLTLAPINAPTKRNRNFVPAACQSCRKHKVKCSGHRPTCRHCSQKGYECLYAAEPGETIAQAAQRKQARLGAQDEFLSLLKTLPEKDAQSVLRNWRSGSDIPTILNHVKAGDILIQMSLLPETRFRYEFPYRSEIPRDYTVDNTYLNSLIYEAASLYADNREAEVVSLEPGSKLVSGEYTSLYLKPFHAAHVVDPLLSDIKFSSWTTVCQDDVLMRDLFSVFLRCEYQFTAAFQKDYFLEDMASEGSDFCSSLLVNIVLAYSCVCYPQFSKRAEYWNPHTLTYRFFAEARRLWELEAAEARITTIQAGILFSVFYNLCGLDEIGQAYRIHGVALANELRLMDYVPDGVSERMRSGRAYAAWALYNWETLVGFSFVHSPLLTQPPVWPLPNPLENAKWYGEIWLKYPTTHSLFPSYFGPVFKARCQFRIIMNEFCQRAYSDRGTLTLGEANDFHARLKGWFEDLSGPLLPKAIVLPGHLQLHIYYSHLVLTIYEPFLDETQAQAGKSSPQDIVAEARKFIQTLVRLYYLRHGFDAMDLFIVIPIMLAGSYCIDAIDQQTTNQDLEALRSSLILMTKGLYEQRRNHYLAEALFRVIRGRMRPQEFALLKGTVDLDETKPEGSEKMMQTVRSHWPVSVVRKREDMSSHILTNLVQTYAHLNVEEDQTGTK